MLERFFLEKFKEKISKHIIIAQNQKFGIDPSYMFASGSSSIESWRKFVESWGPEGRLALKSIVTDALTRSKREQN